MQLVTKNHYGVPGIYKLIFPSGKVYIGQCLDFERRMRQYKNLACKDQPKLLNALRKYGFDSVQSFFTPCLESMLNLCEKTFIAEYNSVLEGYNCTWGGEGVMRGRKHTAETKAKMSESQKNKYNDFSEEEKLKIKERIRASHVGKIHSDKTKEKMRQSAIGNKNRVGKKHSDDTKKMLGLMGSGSKNSMWKGGTERLCPCCKNNKVYVTKKGYIMPYCEECDRIRKRKITKYK